MVLVVVCTSRIHHDLFYNHLVISQGKIIYRDMNLMITMVVGGLWHNPNQNYLIWGALNGLGLVFYNHWKKISPYENSNHWMVRVWKIFSTFTFMTIARIWFRVEGKSE